MITIGGTAAPTAGCQYGSGPGERHDIEYRDGEWRLAGRGVVPLATVCHYRTPPGPHEPEQLISGHTVDEERVRSFGEG